MASTPSTNRVVDLDPEPDLDELNQQLERTVWEVGYTPAKLAAAACARPVPGPRQSASTAR
jgi:hypothetical protein